MAENRIMPVKRLGPCRIDSPVKQHRHAIEHKNELFVCDESMVLQQNVYCDRLDNGSCKGHCNDTEKDDRTYFELAGPREKIYFDPSKTRAGIVTCGGLCPGLNDVVRSIVLGLWNNYQVHRIYGFRYGYQGFIAEYGYEPLELKPETVDGWQDMGGTILGSSRGEQDISEVVDCLEQMAINMLFVLGGDGTIKGALRIAREIENRGLKIAIIGVPKTIDNDIICIDRSFGFDTAVNAAREVLCCAHAESKGTPNGIGLVKLMGRDSGFIACGAALAMSDVNFVLIPEQPFKLEGERGFLNVLHQRLKRRHHAVIAVAEGAGQDLMQEELGKDASGNQILGDIGVYLKDKITSYFKALNFETSVKYLDPSYIIRSVPTNAQDSIYCMSLGHDAVHAAMAGRTDLIVGPVKGSICHIPMEHIAGKRKRVDVYSPLWRLVLESTGQPPVFE